MKIGKYIIDPWNKKNFIPRLIAIGLVSVWVISGILIYLESARIQARIDKFVQEKQEEIQRQQERDAYFRRFEMQRKVQQGAVQNAVDAIQQAGE